MIMNGSFIQIGVAFGSRDTMNPITANGNKQYPTALIDWNSDLCLYHIYPLFPRRRQLILIKNAPTQNMMNILMKSSLRYWVPLPNKARERAKNRQINRGPHRSQFLRSLILLYLCLGNKRTTYRILCPMEISSLIFDIGSNYNGLLRRLIENFLFSACIASLHLNNIWYLNLIL